MKKLIALADIKDSKASYYNIEEFKKAFSKLDGKYSITFEKIYNKRTEKQNKSVWGLYYKLIQQALIESGDEDAYDIGYVHLICKQNCLPKNYIIYLEMEYSLKHGLISKKTGEEIKIPFRLTTTKMTTTEWNEYLENMKTFWYEYLNITLPEL